MARKPKSTSQSKGKAKARTKAPAKSARKPKTAVKASAKKRAAAKKATPAKPAPTKFEHVFDDPRNVKKAIYALFVVCGVSFVLDFFIHRHVDHPWESLFGFYAVYGFVACVLLVLAAKEMRKILMRKDDYYDD